MTPSRTTAVSLRLAVCGEGSEYRGALYNGLTKLGFEPAGRSLWIATFTGEMNFTSDIDLISLWEDLVVAEAMKVGIYPQEIVTDITIIGRDPRAEIEDYDDDEDYSDFLRNVALANETDGRLLSSGRLVSVSSFRTILRLVDGKFVEYDLGET